LAFIRFDVLRLRFVWYALASSPGHTFLLMYTKPPEKEFTESEAVLVAKGAALRLVVFDSSA